MTKDCDRNDKGCAKNDKGCARNDELGFVRVRLLQNCRLGLLRKEKIVC